MPTRLIREGWIDSLVIDMLDANAERFFLRLCLKADDFGRYHAHPQLLKSNLFPLRENVRSTDMTRDLAACEKAGLVRSYEANGGRYLVIEKFNQRSRAATSKFPDPPQNDGRVPVTCPSSDSQPRTYADSETETNAETKPSSSSAAPPTVTGLPSVTAEAIYEAYPRKQARQDAVKAISKALTRTPAATLLERTRAYASATALWSDIDRQYIPHPATWYNRGSYDDDPATWERKSAGDEKGRALFA